MPSIAHVRRAINNVEKLLPGKPQHGPQGDPRWLGMMHLQDDFIQSHPEELWDFVLRWARHPQVDLRDAIACCLLEHILEHHFKSFFPRIVDEVKASRRFRDTLSRCYWMGEAAWPSSARALNRLVGKKRPRFRPRRPSDIAETVLHSGHRSGVAPRS